MTSSQRKELLINLLYFLILAAAAFLAIRYVLPWFLPFLIGFAIAALLFPVSEKMAALSKMNQKICFAALALLLYAALLGLLVFGVLKGIEASRGFVETLPELYSERILPLIGQIRDWVESKISVIAPQFQTGTEEISASLIQNLSAVISDWSGSAVEFAGKLITGTPDVLLGLFFSVLSSLFIGTNYRRITGMICKQLSPKLREILSASKTFLFGSLFKMLKGYLILMLITFGELLLGFWILHIENPAIKALLIAFLDFLPLIGLSLILLPWIGICLLRHDFLLAVGLSALYLVMTLARNFLEPKIVGKQIGLTPLTSLICFYVGLKAFGFWGIFLLPLAVILLKNLHEHGMIHLWKS